MIVACFSFVFLKSARLHVYYSTRYFFPLDCVRSVEEIAPSRWDLIEHGYGRWVFTATTTGDRSWRESDRLPARWF